VVVVVVLGVVLFVVEVVVLGVVVWTALSALISVFQKVAKSTTTITMKFGFNVAPSSWIKVAVRLLRGEGSFCV